MVASYTDTSATTRYINQFYTTETAGYVKSRYIYANGQLVVTIEDAPELGGADLGIGDSASPTTEDCCSEPIPYVPYIHYIHADHLTGSNVVTDDSANLEETLDYYPYGKVRLDETTTGFKEEHKFTSHFYDAQSELSYMEARYEDGKRGQFLSEDPAFLSVGTSNLKEKTGMAIEQYLSDPQQLNSYSYAKNNPLKYVDQEGNIPVLATLVALFTPEIAYSPTSENFENASLERTIVVGSILAGGAEGGAAKSVAKTASIAKNNTLVKNVTGELVNVFRGGNLSFDAKTFGSTLKNGFIDPSLSSVPKGISVNIDPNNANVLKYGGPNLIKSLSKGLEIVQSGRDQGHHVIRPAVRMSVDKFEKLVNRMTRRMNKHK